MNAEATNYRRRRPVTALDVLGLALLAKGSKGNHASLDPVQAEAELELLVLAVDEAKHPSALKPRLKALTRRPSACRQPAACLVGLFDDIEELLRQ
jgi:hypothetical protein